MFDATGLAAGVYTGTLCVNSNDPNNPLVTVPVTLEVNAPPALVFTKTVGTDPLACGTETMIDVLAGTEVVYCYTVVNTGGITLDTHTVVDDQLGLLLNNFALPIAPGAGAYFTVSTPINIDTTNVATWTAMAGNEVVSGTDSAMVNVLTMSIDVTKTVGTDPATCATTSNLQVGQSSTTVYYCYSVTNTGDVTLPLHTVVDDHLGTIMGPNAPYDLGPGMSYWFTQSAVITQSTTNVVTWTASLVTGEMISDTASATVLEQPTDVSLTDFGTNATAWLPALMAGIFLAVSGFWLLRRRDNLA